MASKPRNTLQPAASPTPTGQSALASDSSISAAENAGGDASQATVGTPPSDPPALDTLVVGSDTVPARILRDCWLGPAGEIIELDAASAKAIEASGAVDLHTLALIDQVGDGDGQAGVVIEADED